ncbi:PREDICTED: uncharacterized protein LOC108571650 [Habropoda laboriosa]|uniref:uncharacterized protein LOC108571650 n=1 Tax=Habropoda laboriosa TaxID=597456 RepID=UPI00083D3605|nr:PREDICTED: uncharacterized protein LOC108571650 [Habropoda laboriosa]
MSERRDSTCQKHELPKSLQGTEDADFVWSMITDRFPNAAPLLCEMEAVIDRAEDLLQQLRAPCREIETSTSFCTHDSDESTVMMSARGSLITETDVVEENVNIDKNTTETQIFESSIYKEEVDLNGDSQNSVPRAQDIGSQSNNSFVVHCPTAGKYYIDKSTSSNAETSTDQTVKEVRSLEEWGKIVDSAMRAVIGIQNISKTIETFIEQKESCIVLHRQEIYADVGDSVMEINSDRSQKLYEPKDDAVNVSYKVKKNLGNGDESTPKVNQRAPLSILEAFARRCKIPVEYEYITDGPHRYKSNVYVIRGNLAGFTATCRGESEESTKNELASKILQMIANQQMKDEKLNALTELTNEEMIEVLNLGLDGIKETAQKKLYQLCLEKEEPVPKYHIDKEKTYQGLAYVATCFALGYICEGRGVRECVAKKAAADELYHQYFQD